ncbi:hypothetical protein ACFU7Y_37960 [Kitasatospora sp. NPDC057542]|uniref:hypothetical protein n=1 Tax=Kitasatospora sp. NPDC057542 TaxID=3346162 RepID=UPI003684F915
MNQNTDVPACVSPLSAHVNPDALVLRGRVLKADAGPGPVFAEDYWDLSPAYHLPNHHRGQAAMLFDKIADPVWRLTAKEFAYARLTEITEGCTKLPAPPTVTREVRELRGLFDYLEEFHPGVRLREITDDAVLEAFLDHRVEHGRTKPQHRPQERGRLKWFLTLLFRCRTSMTFDWLERIPWDGRPSRLVAGSRSQENATPRVPPQVLAPYLRGSLFYVQIASKDILAALAEQERLRRPLEGHAGVAKGDTRRKLAVFIDERRRQGRGLPARPDIPAIRGRVLKDDGGVNRALIAELCRVGKAALDQDATVAMLREAVAELGLEPGGMETQISADPVTGMPWRSRFEHKSLLWETRMLVAASYVVTAYLSGMRDSETQSLKPGCHFTEPSPDGVIERHKVRSRVFKGREAVGEEDTWVVIEPVAEAIAVMEALTVCDRIFYRHGFGTRNEGIGTTINDQLNVLRDRLGQVRPHDPIPLVDGEPWRFTTRQFRRTVSWHIARQPYGAVAGKVQYKHLKVAMFEGYAGSSVSGFRAEVETERQLAQLEHFLDQYEDFKAGVRLPARLTAEFGRIREELGDFPGKVVDTARLRSMLVGPARTYYPGVLNDCYFEASTALCLTRRPGAEGDAEPVMNHCQPAKCPNSCVLPRHRGAIGSVIADARQLLAIRPITAPQRIALQQQIDQMRRMHEQAGEGTG